MNTGVVSIGYKCVFYSTLGPGLSLLSQLHIMSLFVFALFVVYVFLLLAEEIHPSSPEALALSG